MLEGVIAVCLIEESWSFVLDEGWANRGIGLFRDSRVFVT
jgi:hypothetical protein